MLGAEGSLPTSALFCAATMAIAATTAALATATASTLAAKLRFCDLAGCLCLSKWFVEVRPANAPETELKD